MLHFWICVYLTLFSQPIWVFIYSINISTMFIYNINITYIINVLCKNKCTQRYVNLHIHKAWNKRHSIEEKTQPKNSWIFFIYLPKIFIYYDRIATQKRIVVSMDMIEMNWKESKRGDQSTRRCRVNVMGKINCKTEGWAICILFVRIWSFI